MRNKLIKEKTALKESQEDQDEGWETFLKRLKQNLKLRKSSREKKNELLDLYLNSEKKIEQCLRDLLKHREK